MEDTETTDGNKADRKAVIGLLNEALATEVICILRYKRHYFMTAGSVLVTRRRSSSSM